MAAAAGAEQTLDFRGGNQRAIACFKRQIETEPIFAGAEDFEFWFDDDDLLVGAAEVGGFGDGPGTAERREGLGEKGEHGGFATEGPMADRRIDGLKTGLNEAGCGALFGGGIADFAVIGSGDSGEPGKRALAGRNWRAIGVADFQAGAELLERTVQGQRDGAGSGDEMKRLEPRVRWDLEPLLPRIELCQKAVNG